VDCKGDKEDDRMGKISGFLIILRMGKFL